MPDNDNRIDRRSFLSALGLSGATVVAGCIGGGGGQNGGGAATPTTTGTATDTKTGDQASPYGGKLRVSVSRKPNTLNPIKHVNGAEYQVTGWLYSNLTRVNHNLEVKPDLAKKWEPNADASQWTFYLREDAKFHHNNEQVTATDVKKTIETVMDPDVGSPGKGTIGPIDSVDALDKTTVRINLTGPYADMPRKMAKQFVRILPANALENNFKEIATTDFGSGPFILEEFKVGSHIRASRYDDYYLKGEDGNQLPFVDEVVQKVYPESTAEISAMGNQNVDIMWEVPTSQWSRVKGKSGAKGIRTSGGSFANLVMRSDKPPFDDNRVRKAFKYAVDKKKLLKGAQNGLGVVAQHNPISPAYQFYEDLDPIPQDLDKAKSLLEEAGHKDGLDLKLYAANKPPVRVDTAVLLKQMLAKINVNIEIKQISYDRYLSNVWSKAPFYMGYYGMRFTVDGILYLLLHSKGSWNEAHWHNEEFDKALNKARQTTDKDKRDELYAKAQKIVQQKGPYVIAFFQDELGAEQDYVVDYQLHPTGFFVPVQDVSLTNKAPTKK